MRGVLKGMRTERRERKGRRTESEKLFIDGVIMEIGSGNIISAYWTFSTVVNRALDAFCTKSLCG